MKQIIFTVSILFLFSTVYSQDSHYWNLQYGTKSTLLGGAVIGSVTDLSATYYNPGAISLFDDPKIILSAKVYQYEQITIVNGAGNNKDLDYSSISPSPTFVAFNIKIDSTGRNKLAISILTRQSMNFEFETRQIETESSLSGLSNSSEAGGLSLQQNFNEIWAGASFSHRVNEIVGVGVTAYVAYRNQSTNFQTVVEGLDTINQISSFLAYRKLKFDNYRALLKVGVGINLNPVTFGFTVTTPSLSVLGTGSYGYHNFYNDPNDPTQNIYQSNYQDEIKAKYNTSWAIGLGGAYWGENLSVHFSAEWFNAVKKYNPITLDPLYSQSSGDTFNKEITQQLKSTINLGLGIDYIFNDKLNFAGSIATDFSANDTNSKSNISVSKWDIYHINAGSTFKLGSSEITLGLSYSFGSDIVRQIADIETPDGGIVNNINSKADVKFSRIKILFGFIF